MGIPRFYGEWLRVRFGGAIRSTAPEGVSSLAIDLNGMIHSAAAEAYGYARGIDPAVREALRAKTPASLEAEFHRIFRTALMKVVQSIGPQDMLILAVDGVVPQAKIAQQRQRRYKAGLRQYADPRRPPIFDTNQVTPGTTFMRNLDADIRLWLVQNKAILPPRIIYSSHMVPGEGEHKIMDFYRNGDVWGEAAELGGAHVLYGLDADLIMLSLLSPQPNIVLTREDVYTYIYIDDLRNQLRAHMGSSTAIDDFIVLMFLLGNDFLPAQPAFHSMGISIDFLIDRYKALGRPLTTHTQVPVTTTGITVTDSQISWPNLIAFLREISAYEPQLLVGAAHKSHKYPSEMLTQALFTGTFEYNIFRQLWYEREIGYYGTPQTLELVSALLVSQGESIPVPTLTPERLRTMILEYFRTFNWTYLYYKEGGTAVDHDYQYPYFHAPLLLDLASTDPGIHIPIPYARENMLVYTPLHQLLAVLPPVSSQFLPPTLQFLYKKDSPIRDLLPNNFVLLLDGVDDEGEGIALLPIATRSRIVEVVKNLGLSGSTIQAWLPDRDHFEIISRGQQQFLRQTLQEIRQTPPPRERRGGRREGPSRSTPTFVQLPVYTAQGGLAPQLPLQPQTPSRTRGTRPSTRGSRIPTSRGRGASRVSWETQGNLM